MQPLIGKLKWLGFLVPVLYIGLVDLVCPLFHPSGPAHLRTHLLIFGAFALGTGAFCFAVCRTLSSKSEIDRTVTLLEEQRRLARELHDGLAQSVASLHLTVTAWERGLDTTADPEVSKRIKELSMAIEEIYDKVREAICGRHCAGVQGEGLFVTLSACTQAFTGRTGIPIRLELPPENLTPIPAPVTTQVLQIVREALSNIYRHSGACEAWINAQVDEGNLSVTITDNGRGFDLRSAQTAGKLGLQVMRERAELVGGSFSVATVLGKGTRITVAIPLDQEKPKWKDQLKSWSLTTTPYSVRG